MGRPHYGLFSPCFGTVAAFHVEQGARVAADEAVAEIEIMKMFTSITACAAGEIEWVVSLGMTVNEGDLLAKIYPSP